MPVRLWAATNPGIGTALPHRDAHTWIAIYFVNYKAFRHVETLFVQGRNLYLADLLLVIQGLFTFRQPIAGLQGTDFYLGRINFLHVERPYIK